MLHPNQYESIIPKQTYIRILSHICKPRDASKLYVYRSGHKLTLIPLTEFRLLQNYTHTTRKLLQMKQNIPIFNLILHILLNTAEQINRKCFMKALLLSTFLSLL